MSVVSQRECPGKKNKLTQKKKHQTYSSRKKGQIKLTCLKSECPFTKSNDHVEDFSEFTHTHTDLFRLVAALWDD